MSVPSFSIFEHNITSIMGIIINPQIIIKKRKPSLPIVLPRDLM